MEKALRIAAERLDGPGGEAATVEETGSLEGAGALFTARRNGVPKVVELSEVSSIPAERGGGTRIVLTPVEITEDGRRYGTPFPLHDAGEGTFESAAQASAAMRSQYAPASEEGLKRDLEERLGTYSPDAYDEEVRALLHERIDPSGKGASHSGATLARAPFDRAVEAEIVAGEIVQGLKAEGALDRLYAMPLAERKAAMDGFLSDTEGGYVDDVLESKGLTRESAAPEYVAELEAAARENASRLREILEDPGLARSYTEEGGSFHRLIARGGLIDTLYVASDGSRRDSASMAALYETLKDHAAEEGRFADRAAAPSVGATVGGARRAVVLGGGEAKAARGVRELASESLAALAGEEGAPREASRRLFADLIERDGTALSRAFTGGSTEEALESLTESVREALGTDVLQANPSSARGSLGLVAEGRPEVAAALADVHASPELGEAILAGLDERIEGAHERHAPALRALRDRMETEIGGEASSGGSVSGAVERVAGSLGEDEAEALGRTGAGPDVLRAFEEAAPETIAELSSEADGYARNLGGSALPELGRQVPKGAYGTKAPPGTATRLVKAVNARAKSAGAL